MQYRNENTITSESELIEGMKVRHIAFGEGEILSVSRGLIELSFTTSIKKFVIRDMLEPRLLREVVGNG